jgi:osmotically-inducible protein OsmY
MKLAGRRTVLLAALVALGLAACQNTAEGVKRDAKDAKESADKAAQAVADAAQKSADAVAKTADAAANVAADAAQSAKDAGEVVAKDARDAARKAKDAASHASERAAEASKDAGAVVAAATNTFDVKAALMTDETIDASHINVDTDAKTRTVVLRGSVPTAEQKTAAERLAAAKATGYKVVNELAVVKQ